MKRILTPFTLAAVGLFFLPTIGHAQATGGAFINGNFGSTSLDNRRIDDEDSSYGVNAGYRWVVSPRTLIGFEAGYVDLGTYSQSLMFASFPNDIPPDEVEWYPGVQTAKSKGLTIGANARFNLSPSWYIGGRAGFLRASLDSNVRVFRPDTSFVAQVYDFNAIGRYAGASVGYDFNKKVSLGLNYDYYSAEKNGLKINPDVLSLSGEYRF